jgi:CRISPR-associated protein Cas2
VNIDRRRRIVGAGAVLWRVAVDREKAPPAMMILVSYDVTTTTPQGRRRLRRIAKICTNYGRRVQNSVFECVLDPAQWASLRLRLLETFDATGDSLRFYYLGSHWQGDVEHHGTKAVPAHDDPIVI